MEAHPIPQNVTSFQFKLVGDMTLKQFGYLAIGLSIAYVIFVAFGVNYPLFSWPLIILSSFLGFAFAFVPINSRPLDHWLKAFLKAVYSPTKRIWIKESKTFIQDPLFKSRMMVFLPSFTTQNQPAPAVQQVATPLPTTEELDKTVRLAREAQNLQVKIIRTERQLTQMKNTTAQPNQVNTSLEELQKLVGQASQVKQQLEGPAPSLISEPKTVVKIVTPVRTKQTQVALTTFPNIINGVVKDAGHNYLDGSVVVIYDREGMPVRALRTNKLGQFSGATPLPNGTYTIETEKDGCSFDVLQIELAGGILPSLQITAKS